MRFFWIVFLTSQTLSVQSPPLFVIWNVGQGQWTSLVQSHSCLHFDMGGEFISFKKVKKACHKKKNQLAISHWDWDHISFITRSKAHLSFFCIFQEPRYTHKKRSVFLKDLPRCPFPEKVHEVIWAPKGEDGNSLSRVFVLDDQILLPGDSPLSEERVWKKKLPSQSIKFWVLGHHGSHTSSSKELLMSLTSLKLVFVSARKKLYGHPHGKVLYLMKKHNIPVLTTEDWGSMALEL